MEKKIGKRSWGISGGIIPVNSNGYEPSFTSHDKVSILNANSQKANLILTIYFEDGECIEPYKVIVDPQRVCKLRFNDLIDPLPIPLNKPFGCAIISDVPIVVQFSRMDTSAGGKAITGTMAY